MKLQRSSLTRGQSTRDFRYTFWENVILGILKPIFTENEIEEWSELPRGGSTKGSTTPGTSVSSRSRQLPSLWIGSLMNYVLPYRLAKSNAAIPWWSVELTDLSHSCLWAFLFYGVLFFMILSFDFYFIWMNSSKTYYSSKFQILININKLMTSHVVNILLTGHSLYY